MTIKRTIQNLYKNPAIQTQHNFQPAARIKQILAADNTRRYLRFQNLQTTGDVHIWFGQEPETKAILEADAGILLKGEDQLPLNVFEQIGEGTWKGEVWASSAGAQETLAVIAYGNQPHPWPGVK